MAWTEFYMQTTGSNLNSGSTTADAASYTSTGGNFDGTSVFTPTDGSTPASSINVGDYVSLYNTGDTFSRCIAKVTAVGGGVNGTVTIDTTIKYGTVPTSNSGSRNLKLGGAWASFAAFATNGFWNTGTSPQPTIFNVKKGTYANGTTNRTLNMTGGTTAPLWFRGYDTTPGDCDSDQTKERPLISFTTSGVWTPSTYNIYSSINFTSASAAATFNAGNVVLQLFRCQFINTGTSTSSIGLTVNGGGIVVQDCYASTASTNNVAAATNNARFVRCVFRSTGGAAFSGAGSPTLIECNVSCVSGVGLSLPTNGGVYQIYRCTIWGCGSHGISIGGGAGVTGVGTFIVDCVIANNTGSGIIYNHATATSNVFRSGNTFYGNSSGNETWVGDHPNLYSITEPSDPLPNAGTGDFTLASGALSRSVEMPFEGLPNTTTYPDRGATQHEDSGGSSIIVVGDEEVFDTAIKGGTTSKIVEVTLRDSTTGAGKTGIAHSSVTASYVREGGTRTAITLTSGTVGDAYSSGKWCEVDSTNCKGVYQLHLPNAAIATGVAAVTVTLQAAGVIDKQIRIVLPNINLFDEMRGGMTALPNANAGANNGLPLGDASARVTLAPGGLDAISVADPGAPGSVTTISKMIVAIWRRWFKKVTINASNGLKTYADDNTTANSTQTVTDDGTTQTQGPAS